MSNFRPTSPLKRALIWGPFSASCCVFFFFFFQYIAGFFEAPRPTFQVPSHLIDAELSQTVRFEPIVVPDRRVGPLKFGLGLSHTSVGKEVRSVFASATILAPQTQQNRTPINVALAVDVSGSMRGEKLEQAKIASRKIIEGLADHDYLSIVVYNTFGRVVLDSIPMNAHNKQIAYDTIHRLVADGGTNISEGLRLSAETVRDSPARGATRRVVFISDGWATEGLYETPELVALAESYRADKVAVSTIGLGLDYNEDLMQKIAMQTTGSYYFVAETRGILEILDLEFGRMKQTLATDVGLEIIAHPGTRVKAVHGFKTRVTDRGVWVEIGSMGAGQQHEILVELDIDPIANRDLRPIMETRLSVTDALSGAVIQHTDEYEVGTIRTAENLRVMTRVQQIRTAQALAEATRLYEQGRTEDAVRVVDTQWKDNSAYMVSEGADKSSFERVNRHLDELKKKMSSINRNSSEGNYLKKYNKAYANDVVQSSIVF